MLTLNDILIKNYLQREWNITYKCSSTIAIASYFLLDLSWSYIFVDYIHHYYTTHMAPKHAKCINYIWTKWRKELWLSWLWKPKRQIEMNRFQNSEIFWYVAWNILYVPCVSQNLKMIETKSFIFTPQPFGPFGPFGYWDHQHLSGCLYVHPHF